MQFTPTRALTTAALTLTLAAGLSACGDDDTAATGQNPGTSSASTPTQTTTATAKQIDEAFVRQMIPHHQMAVEMAEPARKQAKRTEIKDLADEIIAAQEREIAQLTAIAKRSGFALESANAKMADDARTLGMSMDEMGMSMNMGDLDGSSDFDRTFIAMMIPHHEGAIAMAKVQLAKGADPELEKLAEGIIAAQQTEIAAMQTWHERWFGEPVAADSGHSMSGMDHSDHMN